MRSRAFAVGVVWVFLVRCAADSNSGTPGDAAVSDAGGAGHMDGAPAPRGTSNTPPGSPDSTPFVVPRHHEAGASPPDATPSSPADASKWIDAPPTGAPPALTPGVFRDITPPGVNLAKGCCTAYPNEGFDGNTFGVTAIAIDPSHPYTLYVTVDVEGLWKTTDGGSTWKRLGTPNASEPFGTTTTYLDSPVSVAVDPRDPMHLYATQGVRGARLGFWVSHDGGETWTVPPGFINVEKMATNDVTSLAVDPTNFDHALVGSHSPWANGTPAGILETRDGGATFVLHPAAWTTTGSLGIHFFFAQDLHIGSSETWIASTDGQGIFRTDDSGKSWKNVSPNGAVHGGNGEFYFTANGFAYAGANNHMVRSTDHGFTWDPIGPSTQDGYYQVIGDGNRLYALAANTGENTTGPAPFLTSDETDGQTWTPYQGGAQKFTDGPASMRFDPVNRILYAANWRAGLWALECPR